MQFQVGPVRPAEVGLDTAERVSGAAVEEDRKPTDGALEQRVDHRRAGHLVRKVESVQSVEGPPHRLPVREDEVEVIERRAEPRIAAGFDDAVHGECGDLVRVTLIGEEHDAFDRSLEVDPVPIETPNTSWGP